MPPVWALYKYRLTTLPRNGKQFDVVPPRKDEHLLTAKNIETPTVTNNKISHTKLRFHPGWCILILTMIRVFIWVCWNILIILQLQRIAPSNRIRNDMWCARRNRHIIVCQGKKDGKEEKGLPNWNPINGNACQISQMQVQYPTHKQFRLNWKFKNNRKKSPDFNGQYGMNTVKEIGRFK